MSPSPVHKYLPIPVSVAQDIAATFSKSIVIVAAWDPVTGLVHITTFGENDAEKAWAADGGEIVAKALGTMPDNATFFENYRQHCCVASGHVRPYAPSSDVDITLSCVAHPKQDGAPTS